MELGGKVAVVTGGGSGLGREIALEYAAQGASVVVSSHVPVENEAVSRACRDAGGRAIAVTADVSSEQDVHRLVERCLSEFGRLDVLVAAAGLDVRESATREDRHARHVTLEQWNTVIGVNLTGTFLSAREAIRHMVDQGSGSIVTFSSGTARNPAPGLAAYASSKAAIEALTTVLALETAGHGVRVNALQPGGMTDTPFFPPSVTAAERALMHQPSVIRACAVYLASDESAGVSGQSLVASDWNRERGLVLCPCPVCSAA